MPYKDPQKAKESKLRYLRSPKGKAMMRRRNARHRNNPANKEKIEQYRKKYAASKKGKAAMRRGLLKKYNWTTEQYKLQLKKQKGLCAFCLKPPHRGIHLDVDHDHACCNGNFSCGECIRGLVHRKCNRLIGTVETYAPKLKEFLKRVGR